MTIFFTNPETKYCNPKEKEVYKVSYPFMNFNQETKFRRCIIVKMDNGRNYIIDRLKSKKVTIDEFNFDKLSAPPLSLFLSPQDIWELNSIAKSIKYSGKLKEKLQSYLL